MNKTDDHIQFMIYADGASSKNGDGGYGGIVLVRDTREVIEYGGESKDTTNNQMELAAAIHGLALVRKIGQERKVPYFARCKLVSDSQYVIYGLQKWADSWERHGWMTFGGQPVKNVDLWKKLIAISNLTGTECMHVRGHIGIVGNEHADKLAGLYKSMAHTNNVDFKANLDRLIAEVK